MARKQSLLERLAHGAARWTGSSVAFALALAVIVLWLASGPIFGYSNTWQLVVNTGTTIVTFLMVFLLQRSQNKESLALQLKLNELVAAVEGASNRLINVEDLGEEEVRVLHEHYGRLVALATQAKELQHSHSIEEAEARHRLKSDRGRQGKERVQT
jgi:low affinity Fe/Cu permease